MTYKEFSKMMPEEQLIYNHKVAFKGAIMPEILIKQWAQQTKGMLINQLRKRNIKNTGALEDSLSSVVNGSTNVQHIVLSFLKYGTYVDMGVGRGRTLDMRREGNFNAGINRLLGNKMQKGRRHSKFNKKSDWQWYSKSLYGAISKGLPKVLAEAYGVQAARAFQMPQVYEMYM